MAALPARKLPARFLFIAAFGSVKDYTLKGSIYCASNMFFATLKATFQKKVPEKLSRGKNPLIRLFAHYHCRFSMFDVRLSPWRKIFL